MKEAEKKAKILIQGTVQAVGFRPFIYRLATEMELPGTVKNLGDTGVKVTLEGSKNKIQQFIGRLTEENPPLSEIQSIDIEYHRAEGLEEFQILESDEGSGEKSGTIPPDAAICDKCLADMRNPNSRYQNYWATSCVDCGPRFTIIRALPYDRPRTSMDEFPMCEDCREEYENPSDRRYHAQTIACPSCGPKLFSQPPSEDPIPKTADILQNGDIAAIKGIGGTHLACDAYDSKAIRRLKERLRRPHQPLAIMAKDLEMVEEFAISNERERKALTSLQRPIVVLNQRSDSPLSPEIAEGLHNVGTMLPYSGLHHLIFDHLDFPLVMTSANIPGEPMLVENEEITSKLDDVADFMLLHERKVVARCDDSVVRFSGGNRKFIRRSRGWAPSPIAIPEGDPVIALGAELDNTIAIFDGKNCYISQYIGDVDNLKTFEFLKKTIDHITNIANLEIPNRVACDLHPEFMTTELAQKMSENPIRVQHHHAHLAAVLAEKNLQEAIGIVADGVGYGVDGTIWGGEVMYSNKSDFERLGHLTPMLMPGGDQATKYPSRMIAGIFHESPDLPKILRKHCKFPRGEDERKVVEKQVKTGFNSPTSTSAGRFLDAVSSLLDVCQERSYEGEPAMKLESFSLRGSPLNLEPELKKMDGKLALDVQSLMRRLIEFKESGEKREDIAATAQNCVAEGLARIAVNCAENRDVKNIALTGGVAYNDKISWEIRNTVEEAGLNFVTNEKVPCGDGGTSFGQAVVASRAE